jgi:hypothetical protein
MGRRREWLVSETQNHFLPVPAVRSVSGPVCGWWVSRQRRCMVDQQEVHGMGGDGVPGQHGTR